MSSIFVSTSGTAAGRMSVSSPSLPPQPANAKSSAASTKSSTGRTRRACAPDAAWKWETLDAVSRGDGKDFMGVDGFAVATSGDNEFD